jgi:hypothetical protein
MVMSGSTYDPDKYYTEAGTSFRTQVRLNIPRNHNDAMAIIRGANENYSTSGDQHRNYFVHGMMKDIKKLEADGFIEAAEEARELIDLQERIEAQHRKKERREMELEFYRVLEENVELDIHRNDVDSMQDNLNYIEDLIGDPNGELDDEDMTPAQLELTALKERIIKAIRKSRRARK